MERHRIKAGTKWAPQIREALDKTRVALLLVSTSFLGSPFIRNEELRAVLAATQRGELSLYWVPVTDALSETFHLDQWQAAPGCDPKRPLNLMTGPEREQVIVTVCRAILDEMGRLPSISRTDRNDLKRRVGETVADKYRDLEEIGTGSSSIVYKAVGPHGEPFVVKALAASRWEPSAQDDLCHRAALAQKLKHPAYIDIYDEFLDRDPCCVVTEYVDGILDRYRESCGGQIAPRRVRAPRLRGRVPARVAKLRRVQAGDPRGLAHDPRTGPPAHARCAARRGAYPGAPSPGREGAREDHAPAAGPEQRQRPPRRAAPSDAP